MKDLPKSDNTNRTKKAMLKAMLKEYNNAAIPILIVTIIPIVIMFSVVFIFIITILSIFNI